ncbi:hypothetical protein L7F22_045738 [Adiantum nelumboides]|nr:hypothetical protein [Adiantum nelumboides]
MEGNDIPLHNAFRGNTRPEFVPKQPPRRRQRGALPRLDEQQHGFFANNAPTPQVRVSTSTSTIASQQQWSPEDQRNAFLPPRQQPLAPPMHSIEETAKQSGLFPKPRDPMGKRQNTAHRPRDFARGSVSFSRSWHRASTQEQPNQRGALMPTDGHTHWPQQRGAIPPQDQSVQAPPFPFAVPPLSQGSPNAPPLSGQNARTLYPLLETKALFEGMWHQLEVAIQCREGMLVNMKAEMANCLSLAKSAKVDALKEKEEAEARKAAASDNLESINKQVVDSSLSSDGTSFMLTYNIVPEV